MSANTNADVAAMVERLANLRVTLKSGDYDGADLMRAWCAMMDAATLIQSQQAEITRLSALLEERTEALRKIVAPYDRDGCMMGERYADAVWIAKAAISTEDK